MEVYHQQNYQITWESIGKDEKLKMVKSVTNQLKIANMLVPSNGSVLQRLRLAYNAKRHQMANSRSPRKRRMNRKRALANKQTYVSVF